MFRIGGSPLVVQAIPELPDVTKAPGTYDVTIVLASEKYSVVEGKWRTLRPHFVPTIAEAHKVYDQYLRMVNGDYGD